MTARSGIARLPGEELAWPLPLAALLLAATSAGAAAREWRGDAAISEAPVPSAPVPAPPLPAPPPPSSIPTSSASGEAAPLRCPRLVIQFAHASASLPQAALAPLEKLGAWLVTHPEVTVVLDGHADAVGTEHGNLVLSRSRADQIAKELAARGVSRARLTTRGFGAFSPLDEEREAAANRRVVVQVRGGAECPHAKEEVIEP